MQLSWWGGGAAPKMLHRVSTSSGLFLMSGGGCSLLSALPVCNYLLLETKQSQFFPSLPLQVAADTTDSSLRGTGQLTKIYVSYTEGSHVGLPLLTAPNSFCPKSQRGCSSQGEQGRGQHVVVSGWQQGCSFLAPCLLTFLQLPEYRCLGKAALGPGCRDLCGKC